MSDQLEKPYVKVPMPGFWYYTQDPPPKWRIILSWVIGVPLVMWPVSLFLVFIAVVFGLKYCGYFL